MACLKGRGIHHGQRRGVAAVEMAIALPLLILLILGLIEYSWLFLTKQALTNSARQGARIGATLDATSDEVRDAVTQSMTSAGLAASGYSVTITPGDITALTPGEPLTVTVQLSYANVGLIKLALIPTPATLASSAVMAREGIIP